MIHRAPSSVAFGNVASIRISLLDATVCRGAEVFELSGRELELTYCIALRDRPVARPTLMADLWPDTDEQDATNAFHISLHRLRKRLGRRDAICLTPHGYVLGADVLTDFRALELFLKSLAGRSSMSDHEIELASAAYQLLGLAAIPTQIADTEIGEMFDQKVEYLKRGFAKHLAALSLQFDRTEKALHIAQEMIRIDGCDESAWEIAIRAHLANNDRGAAIRDFRTYARNLAREFGLEPSRRIKQLIVQCEGETPSSYALQSR